VRVIREEFNADYRGVVIDDERLYHEIREYVAAFNPELADRIELETKILEIEGQIQELGVSLGDGVRGLMEAFWPGPLTVVVKAPGRFPATLTAATGTIGLRIPGGAVAQSILTAFGGPIIGTSANKAGGADPADAKTVQRAVGGQIDLILDGGRVALGVPSTVIDCSVEPARLLREGAVPRATLAAKIALA